MEPQMVWLSQLWIWITPAIGTLFILRLWAAAAPARVVSPARRLRGR
jgi:hypothetical protein